MMKSDCQRCPVCGVMALDLLRSTLFEGKGSLAKTLPVQDNVGNTSRSSRKYPLRAIAIPIGSSKTLETHLHTQVVLLEGAVTSVQSYSAISLNNLSKLSDSSTRPDAQRDQRES
jgi:hypothetical protein